jgi:O-antigen/teichoic acid export membrane protein
MKEAKPRKLAINFALLTLGEGLSKIFSFVAFAYLARILGPDTYGDIEFALALALFFNLVVEAGLGILGAREIAKDEKSVVSLTFHIVIMRCFLAIGAFLILLVFTSISNKTGQEKQLVVLYGLTLFGTPGLLQWVFQGLDRMHWVALSSVIRWSLFAGLVFLFIFNPKQVWIVPLIELGAIACVVAFNFTIFRYFFGRFWRRFDISFAFTLLRQALPIGLTQVTWGLRAYLPIIAIGLMVGGEAVGWFGAAHRVVLALHSFVWMYFFNLYPSISRCTQLPPETLRRFMGKSMQLTAWASVFIGSIGVLFAEPLMTTVYGAQYHEATIAFKVLIWVISFILISGHYMYSLFAYDKQWFELLTAVCGAVISILLNFFLILWYGFIGAAYALLCTEAVIWIMNYYFVRREIIHLPFLRHLTKPVIIGTVMILLVFIMPQIHFLILGAAAALVYVIGVLILQPSIINDFRVIIAGNR